MVIYIAAKNAMTIAMHKNSTNNRLHAQENNSYIQCESIINLCKIALTGLVFFAVLYIVPGIVTCRNNSSVAIVIASMHINSIVIGVFRGVSCMHARYVLQTLYEGQLYIASYSRLKRLSYNRPAKVSCICS